MATKAQIEANRKNAAKSTGPTTDAGKARVRTNAIRHHLCGSVALMTEENDKEFNLLLADLREEHQPEGPTEDIFVYKMAEYMMFSERASVFLAEAMDTNTRSDDTKQISLFLRYHTTADRGFIRNLNELRKLQKERRLQEIGFVSQNTESQPGPRPDAEPENVENPPSDPENAPAEFSVDYPALQKAVQLYMEGRLDPAA